MRGFESARADFERAGAEVLGVSKDPIEEQEKFSEKEGLGFPLLSDVADVSERYGVWKEKTLYGKTRMGIERTTFLIDGAGRVARVWPKVKVEGHADEVLEAVRGS